MAFADTNLTGKWVVREREDMRRGQRARTQSCDGHVEEELENKYV